MGTIRFQTIQKNGVDHVQEIHTVVVHRFTISEFDDPEIYAAEPIMRWQNSESGKFVMEHSITAPVFYKHLDYTTVGYQYAISAELEKNKYSEFLLRFGQYGNN